MPGKKSQTVRKDANQAARGLCSCVATCNKFGRVRVVQHANRLTTPSVVAYTATGKIVGEKAWMQVSLVPDIATHQAHTVASNAASTLSGVCAC